jgi:hypothetical protein
MVSIAVAEREVPCGLLSVINLQHSDFHQDLRKRQNRRLEKIA